MTDRELMQQAADLIKKMYQTHLVSDALRARLAQPEPEPIGYVYSDANDSPSAIKHGAIRADIPNGTPLYTAPPRREWQGLTDEEIRNEAKNHVFDESFFSGAVWARGKIMGKNHG